MLLPSNIQWKKISCRWLL